MNQHLFWELIEAARTRSDGDLEDFGPNLVEMLCQLPVEDLMTWKQIFWEYHNASYKNKLWAAAFVLNGGCSDDGFDYFRAWLIAQGREIFMAALANPEVFVYDDVMALTEGGCEYEEMLSLAEKAFLAQVDHKADYDDFYAEVSKYPLSETMIKAIYTEIAYDPDIDQEWDEDDLEDIVPLMCEAFDW